MIRWCEHNRRSDGARGPQRRPCPLARGTRCVAGPGRGGSRPVSGHALHELSCPRGCHKAHPVATLMTGGREAAGGAAHLSGREAAADTRMATCTGHWPSGRRSFRKQRTVNPPIVPARKNFLYRAGRGDASVGCLEGRYSRSIPVALQSSWRPSRGLESPSSFPAVPKQRPATVASGQQRSPSKAPDL